MTTIPVERELLEQLYEHLATKGRPYRAKLRAQLRRTLLAEQPQAGAGQVHCSECGPAVLDCDKRGCFGLASRHDQANELRRLREALSPFAALAQLFDDGARGGTMPATGAIAAWPRLGANRELIENELTVEHLRAARAALTHSQQGAKE